VERHEVVLVCVLLWRVDHRWNDGVASSRVASQCLRKRAFDH
jgi:hypothetical protein